MKRLFEILLQLYPAGQRELFGTEMLRVFERAAEDHRARGRLAFARFAVAEAIGLLGGAAGARPRSRPGARAIDLRKMRPPAVTKAAYVTALDEVLAAEHSVAVNLRLMQDAIARREFVQARFFSDEERSARQVLRLVHRKYRIAE